MKQRFINFVAIFGTSIAIYLSPIFEFDSFSNNVMANQNGIPIYVDDNAPPGGNGSKENPFQTILEGLNAADYGDTVLVLPGTYTENVVMKTGVALFGSGAKVTTIRPNVYEKALAIVIGANDAIFQGFTIIHPGSADQRHAIYCQKCSMKIFDNIIINYGSEHNSGSAIECYDGGATVARNLIHSFGVSLSCYDSANVMFRNNVIIDQKQNFKIGVNLNLILSSKITIQNNTFVFIGNGHGISIIDCEWLSTIVISNNIIYIPYVNAFGIVNSEGPLQESFNNIWVGGIPYNGCNPGVGDIQLDPGFVNIDRSDFRLAEGSPCIDAGDPNPIYKDVDGTRNDMGAFGGPDPINLSLTLKLFASIATSSVSGFPGDTVKVSVELENAAGIAQAHCIIDFDSGLLRPVHIQKTSLTKDFSLKANLKNSDQVGIELSHNKEISSGEGSIVDIFFLVNENAQSEQASPLRLLSITLWDGSGSLIDLQKITHGVFVVNYMTSSQHVIYVDPKNIGSENGSQKMPFNTITEGINEAEEGDTVFVAGGIYHEILEINKGIFLKGAGAPVTTVVVDSQLQFEDYVVHLNTDKPCGISGFTIKNKPATFMESLLLVDAPKAVIMKNKIIADDIMPGVSVVDWSIANGGIMKANYIQGFPLSIEIKNSSNLLVHNNTFVPGDYGSVAILCQYSKISIIDNKFDLIGAAAAIFATASSELIIKNNLIKSQTYSSGGISIIESTAEIINNTIVVNDYGIWSGVKASTTIMNNIIIGFNRGSWGIRSEGTTTSSYNDLWGHDRNYSGASPGLGDISASPIFLDSARSDFHLKSNSPCIDAGNPDPIYNDLDGSRNDMGAFGGPFADTTGFLGRQIAVAFVEPQNRSGDTLCIPVTATSVQGISNIEMKVEYNESHLHLLAVRHGEITQPFSLSESQETPGITQLRLSSPLVVRQSSGSICELIAQVQTTNDTATVIRLNDLVFKDQLENIYNAAPVEGIITIAAVKSGNKGQNLVPDQFALLQNYPNPFNPSTVIRYNLPTSSFISLKIYNLLGQEIRSLYEGIQSSGDHQLIWDGKDNHGIELPSGLYFCRLSVESGRWIQTKKLVLIR